LTEWGIACTLSHEQIEAMLLEDDLKEISDDEDEEGQA
jgi:hypothetical protein